MTLVQLVCLDVRDYPAFAFIEGLLMLTLLRLDQLMVRLYEDGFAALAPRVVRCLRNVSLVV